MQRGSGQSGTCAGKELIRRLNSLGCVYLALSDLSCFICHGTLPLTCEVGNIRLKELDSRRWKTSLKLLFLDINSYQHYC